MAKMSKSQLDKAGKRIGAAWRKARGKRTQAQVAQILHLSPNHYARLERGEERPSATLLIESIDEMGVDPNDLRLPEEEESQDEAAC
jgi:transcriptional regulator with XRE-family HTH domain